MKRLPIALSLLLILAFVLAACQVETPTPEAPPQPDTSTPGPEAPPAEPGPPEEAPPPEEEATLPEGESLAGQTVSVIAVWAGSELDSFRAMVAPWEELTGATVEYEGTRDLNAVLQTRVQGGNPPDIAGLPGPGQLAEFAQDGVLVDLSTFMDMDELAQQYDRSWLDLASHEGGLYGIFMKATVKSLVWYRPDVFEEAGYEIPETWDDLIALSDQIVADGGTPWCVGLESGAASGWPGTDWIEDIMLRTAGPELYDQWRLHEIPWTDESVRNAWEMFGAIVTNDEYVLGGPTAALATNFGEAPSPMFDDPPGCYLHKQASFITDFIQQQFPDLEPGVDYTFFPFPEDEPQYGTPALSAGDLLGMFNDTPAARSLMVWLASAEAQQIWAERGGFLAANVEVSPSVYPDEITRQMAEILIGAEVVRFDASDLMPAAVNDAFWGGILDYVQDPGSLDSVLQSIEAVAVDAYGP